MTTVRFGSDNHPIHNITTTPTSIVEYHRQKKERPMGTTLTTVEPAIERDRWGRPKIILPDSNDTAHYTRATTLAGTLDDTFGLEKWKIRKTAVGLASRDDLLLAIKAAEENDTRTIDRACKDAQEAAGINEAATEGTALHRLTDIIDLGEELPTVPEHHEASLAAYVEATAHLQVEAVEQFLVCDQVQAAGTADRIVRWPGGPHGDGPFIADLKTGSIKHSALKIAMQLAIYANGQMYDPATGERTPTGVRTDLGLIVHMPRGEGTCQLWWTNLAAGWEAVQVAAEVRAWRKRKDLTQPAN